MCISRTSITSLSKKELRTSLFPEIKPSNGNNNLRMNQKAHNMTELI